MEITNVEATAVSVPVLRNKEGGIAPYRTNHGAVTDVERVLIRVDTDEGISGWGEMRPILSPEATIATIEEGVAPIVEGRSPYERESLRRLLFIEYTNVDVYFAPIEVACWDIIGKDTGKPVYELLGGWTAPSTTERRVDAAGAGAGRVDVAYCAGIESPEESREHAARAREEGYDVLKTKAGRDWQEDVARIVAMDDEVDGDLEFRLDPNQGWRLDEAVRVGAALADKGVYLQYMEQPIRVDAHDSLSALRDRLPQPIAANEDTYIAHNLGEMATTGAVDVAVVDLTPAGGITGLRELVAVADDAAIELAHHCAFDLGIRTAAVLHAVYGLPGFSLPPDSVYDYWADDVIEDRLEVSEGAITVPEEPGLGITVDEAAIEDHRID